MGTKAQQERAEDRQQKRVETDQEGMRGRERGRQEKDVVTGHEGKKGQPDKVGHLQICENACVAWREKERREKETVHEKMDMRSRGCMRRARDVPEGRQRGGGGEEGRTVRWDDSTLKTRMKKNKNKKTGKERGKNARKENRRLSSKSERLKNGNNRPTERARSEPRSGRMRRGEGRGEDTGRGGAAGRNAGMNDGRGAAGNARKRNGTRRFSANGDGRAVRQPVRAQGLGERRSERGVGWGGRTAQGKG